MTTGPSRCHYALRPAERPSCQLTQPLPTARSRCAQRATYKRSTLGKGQARRQLPDTEPDPIALRTEARRQLIDAHGELQAAVTRARQHYATWAAIARVPGTTRQAAQQRFTGP